MEPLLLPPVDVTPCLNMGMGCVLTLDIYTIRLYICTIVFGFQDADNLSLLTMLASENTLHILHAVFRRIEADVISPARFSMHRMSSMPFLASKDVTLGL